MKRNPIKTAAVAVFLLVGGMFLGTPAHSQDLGNVGLRTVNAVLTGGAPVTCTGTPQIFSTTSTALNNAGFRNLGQTGHLATATSNAAAFQMEIDGIDNLGNVFRLSDLQLGVPTSAKGGIVLTANGYMPNIQISVTCTAAATFSVSYSGSFSPQPQNLSGILLAAVDKLPFQTAAANTNASVTFQTPTGNSSGTIIFQYAAAGPAGSTITAQCLTNAGTNLALYTFSLAQPNTAQLFNVTAGTCPFVTLTYTSGGASATTYNLEYVFNSQGTNNALADPCLSPTSNKLSQPFTITTATTTQIIPLVAGQKIYPCGAMMDLYADSSQIYSFQWEYGTGANCGTGTTAVSGVIKTNSSAESEPFGFSGGTWMNIPIGNALCAVTVAISGGPGINAAGVIAYVQQ